MEFWGSEKRHYRVKVLQPMGPGREGPEPPAGAPQVRLPESDLAAWGDNRVPLPCQAPTR